MICKVQYGISGWLVGREVFVGLDLLLVFGRRGGEFESLDSFFGWLEVMAYVKYGIELDIGV